MKILAEVNHRGLVTRWSTNTDIRVNGKAIAEKVTPGTYLEINREWKSEDTIELTLDFKLRFWYGKEECQGKVSGYRGPILLTYDARFNEIDPGLVWAILKNHLGP